MSDPTEALALLHADAWTRSDVAGHESGLEGCTECARIVRILTASGYSIVRSDELERLRAALEAEHVHTEYGHFGHMASGGTRAWIGEGWPGCQVCESLGRPLHVHDRAMGCMDENIARAALESRP